MITAAFEAALPWLPLSLVGATLATLDLVSIDLAVFYRFAALGPPLLAAALAGVAVLFPANSQDDQVRRYLGGLLRLGAHLVFYVLFLSSLLPLLGYPEEVRSLLRAVLGLVLLIAWVGVLVRKQELLAVLGADEAAGQ